VLSAQNYKGDVGAAVAVAAVVDDGIADTVHVAAQTHVVVHVEVAVRFVAVGE